MRYRANVFVPMVLTLNLSCNQEKEPECFSFNQTTITITRNHNGKISSFDSLNQSDSTQILSEPALDLVNETHNLGTEPLPPDINLTRAPRFCLDRPGLAYALTGEEYTRGIYFVSDFSTLGAIENLNHEIGHLQPGGHNNEVMAELNEFEQKVMAYTLFAASEENDIIQWAYRNAEIDGSLGHLSNALERDWSDSDDDSEIPYTKSDMFILIKLSDPSINFRSLRDQIIAYQEQGTLESNIGQTANDFLERFNPTKYNSKQARRADVVLTLTTTAVRELNQRFGEEIAQRYINAHSYFPYEQERKRAVVGLEGRVCSLIADHSDPEQQYCPIQDLPEGIICEQPLSLDFCCIQLDQHQIVKSIVHTQGARLISERTQKIIFNNLAWSAVDQVSIMYEERLQEIERCK